MTSINAPSESDGTPSDEEMRKMLVPKPSVEELRDAILLHYHSSNGSSTASPGEEKSDEANDDKSGVVVVKQLDSYDDANYLVKIDGVKYLAKVHNGVESEDYIKSSDSRKESSDDIPRGNERNLGDTRKSAISLQNALMNHLSKNDILTSRPIMPTNGSEAAVIHPFPVLSAAHSPRPLVLRLLAWVDGHTMSSCERIPVETLVDAGILLGKICHALEDFPHGTYEASLRCHEWDGKNTMGLRKFVHCIENEARRGLVESVIDEFERRKPLLDGLRLGMLMADFNDANIIMNNRDDVKGVIDFGDSVYSWRVLDVSIAMAYAMLTPYGKSGHSLAAAAALLRGFHRKYPLDPEERKHLLLLITCRLACSATLGAYSLSKNPSNSYLLLHAQPCWEALELIGGGGCDSDAIHKLFDTACDDDGNVMDCSGIAIPDPRIVDLLSSCRRTKPTEAPPLPKKMKVDIDSEYTLTFVTGNKKKLEEVKRILSDSLPFTITNQKLDLPELQGGDATVIAKEKCTLAALKCDGPVITEDTSLCFHALNGMPGPYIKWFLDKCGLHGLTKLLAGHEDKRAYAQTIVAFCAGPGRDVVVFDGRTEGRIVESRGAMDFGWDPIFEPREGEGEKTYAEMNGGEKDSVSHRRKAFDLLKGYLTMNEDEIKKQMGPRNLL